MFLHPTHAPTGNDLYTITTATPAAYPAAVAEQAPVCSCQHHAPASGAPFYGSAPAPAPAPAPVPALRTSVAPYVAAGVGAVGAVVVVGVVLVGLMLAFAVSALALAVVVAVLRGLLNSPQQRGR